MPRAGLTMTEGTISEWFVEEGSRVSKGDKLMEFENEKNIIPYEALDSGIIHITAQADDTVAVGEPIGYLAADEAEYNALVGGAAPQIDNQMSIEAPASAPTAAPATNGSVTEISMPRAGLTMTEGTISEWFVSEGAFVNKGDKLMEFENEKNMIPYEALDSGIIHIIAQVEDTVAVGEPIGWLAANEEIYKSVLNGGAVATSVAATATTAAVAAAAPVAAQATGGRVRATGYAKKLAAAKGIDLSLLGKDGQRIRARDVEAYAAASKNAPVQAAAPEVKAEPVSTSCAYEDVITETPWTGVRKTIAKNMLTSLQQSAQTTSICEVDVTELLKLRAKLVENQELLGTKVTVNDLICMLMAKVAAKHPLVNATFDGKTLYSHSRVHLSFAVGAEHGLMVPVIKNIDTMSISEISKTAKDLAVRAKNKQLKPEEQAGGTFCVSNVGMFPIDIATPVINPPQTAIVGIGRTVKKPVVMPDGSFEARDMMHVFLTFDHRVIDGLEAGRFFADMEKYFKCPELILA